MISNLAHIHPNAQIGANVTIDPFSVIHDDVVIGDGTHVMSNVTIFSSSRIGKNCNIFPGAVIGAVPQDLKYRGEYTLTEIGDNTSIRECVTIHRGTTDKNTTKVGSNCLIMSYAHIAHDCIVGNNCIVVNAVQMAGHVEMGDFAIIGGSSAVHQFVKIGAHVMAGFASHISQDVPPFMMVDGNPLAVRGLNIEGLRRRGFSPARVSAIKQMHRLLYRQGLTLEAARACIADLPAVHPEAAADIALVQAFLDSSTRGIAR